MNPPSLHRYVYTLNNPVVYTDPSGMSAAELAADAPFAGFLAEMMVASLALIGGAIAELLLPALTIIAAVVVAVFFVGMIVFFAYDFVQEMGRINDWVEAKKAYAESQAGGSTLLPGRWRNRGPNDKSECYYLAVALTKMRYNSAAYWATLALAFYYCFGNTILPGGLGGGSAPPGPLGGGGPSGEPPDVPPGPENFV